MDFEPSDKSLPFDGEDKLDVGVLETFPYEYAGKDAEIEIVTEEFTSVCPYSGLPDFGRLTISYVPARKCLELRALKYYLLSYRNVGIFYEHLVNRILEDLVRACRPRAMTVRGEFTVRGGLRSTITATHPRSRRRKK